MNPIESVCLSLASSAFMSSGAAADFVTGAGAGFAGWLAATGGTAGFAGAVVGLVVGGVIVGAAAAAGTVAAAGGGSDGALDSTVLMIVGGAGAGVSCVGDPAVMATAGSAVSGALPGSLAAIGALCGPAQAEIHSAKNAIAKYGSGVKDTLVRDISSPINGKHGQVNIIRGNLWPRVPNANWIVTIHPPASVLLPGPNSRLCRD